VPRPTGCAVRYRPSQPAVAIDQQAILRIPPLPSVLAAVGRACQIYPRPAELAEDTLQIVVDVADYPMSVSRVTGWRRTTGLSRVASTASLGGPISPVRGESLRLDPMQC
jgi:hypothetical protein